MNKPRTIAVVLFSILCIGAYYFTNRFLITYNAPSLDISLPLNHATTVGRDGAPMVFIAAGDFYMGDPEGDELHYDEIPCHKVYLDAFWIDCYEVTNRRYKKFIDATGHRVPYIEASWAEPYNWKNNSYPEGKGDFPVVLVSWEDAVAYARWAGKRLPTEAEWEKAARGGLEKKSFPWGERIIADRANYFTSITVENSMKPVGSFRPNRYGIFDVAGNVWEWCSDWYGKRYYRNSSTLNPTGPPEGVYRVYRGGSWTNRAEHLRCSERGRNVPIHQSHTIGFRCVLPAEKQPGGNNTPPQRNHTNKRHLPL